MTYDEALSYIHGVNWTFCKPGLERIGELCERLGHPERDLKFVHVAGTNGKGSFCSMLDSILRAAGYKVGLYTSPYILEFGERMRVGGENISRSDLAAITEYVKPIADSMTDKPTEFELITAIAFEYFKRQGCDVVVLEAGMGGRLDSTNIIDTPILSVITGIALDHTAFLGDTVEKIAAEKAGIIKNAPVLFGGTDESAYNVIKNTAYERKVKLTRPDYSNIEVVSADVRGTKFNYGEFENIKINLLGLYQPKNAALVIEAVKILRSSGMNIPDSAVYSGLEGAVWHARFEVIATSPLVIFDGAHNPEGVVAATESIKHYFGDEGVIAVSGVLADKDYRFIAEKIARVAPYAFTMTPDNPRALGASEYAEELSSFGSHAVATCSVGEAVKCATELAEREGRAVVCLGSLYTYGDVVSEIEKLGINKRR